MLPEVTQSSRLSLFAHPKFRLLLPPAQAVSDAQIPTVQPAAQVQHRHRVLAREEKLLAPRVEPQRSMRGIEHGPRLLHARDCRAALVELAAAEGCLRVYVAEDRLGRVCVLHTAEEGRQAGFLGFGEAYLLLGCGDEDWIAAFRREIWIARSGSPGGDASG